MTYEYAYEIEHQRHVVERDFPMGKNPAEILLKVDGQLVVATLHIGGGAGRMTQNWARWRT